MTVLLWYINQIPNDINKWLCNKYCINEMCVMTTILNEKALVIQYYY